MSVSGPLTFNILDGYLRCKYLGFLRLAGQHGETSEYAASLDIRRASARAAALEKIGRQSSEDLIPTGVLLTREVLRGGAVFLLDTNLECDDISLHFDGLQRVSGSSVLGDFHYVPVLFGGDRHLHRTDRALLELLGLLLADVQGTTPRYGLFYHWRDGRMSRVRF
jgi:hypothetical protein